MDEKMKKVKEQLDAMPLEEREKIMKETVHQILTNILGREPKHKKEGGR